MGQHPQCSLHRGSYRKRDISGDEEDRHQKDQKGTQLLVNAMRKENILENNKKVQEVQEIPT